MHIALKCFHFHLFHLDGKKHSFSLLLLHYMLLIQSSMDDQMVSKCLWSKSWQDTWTHFDQTCDILVPWTISHFKAVLL